MTITIAAAIAAYEADRRKVVVSRVRLTTTARPILRIIGEVTITNQSDVAAAVKRYIATRRKEGLAPATIRRELITLRAALRLAWGAGHLPFQPRVATPPGKAPDMRALTIAETNRLVEAADERLRLFLAIALTIGARISAILDLTWRHVDLNRMTIDFRARDRMAHRRKHRAVVAIGPAVAAVLRTARTQSRRARVVPHSAWWVRRHLAQAAAKAKIGRVTPHTLRHTVATYMLRDGRASLITEQVYAHLTAEHLRSEAQLLEGLALTLPVQGATGTLIDMSGRMGNAELKRIGERMYGSEWQSPLARDLGVAVRTVQRWAAGDSPVPDLRRDLAQACRRKATDLAALANEIDPLA